MNSDDWRKVVDMARKWGFKLAEINTDQQVGLVMTVLGVRNCLLERKW